MRRMALVIDSHETVTSGKGCRWNRVLGSGLLATVASMGVRYTVSRDDVTACDDRAGVLAGTPTGGSGDGIAGYRGCCAPNHTCKLSTVNSMCLTGMRRPVQHLGFGNPSSSPLTSVVLSLKTSPSRCLAVNTFHLLLTQPSQASLSDQVVGPLIGYSPTRESRPAHT